MTKLKNMNLRLRSITLIAFTLSRFRFFVHVYNLMLDYKYNLLKLDGSKTRRIRVHEWTSAPMLHVLAVRSASSIS